MQDLNTLTLPRVMNMRQIKVLESFHHIIAIVDDKVLMAQTRTISSLDQTQIMIEDFTYFYFLH